MGHQVLSPHADAREPLRFAMYAHSSKNGKSQEGCLQVVSSSSTPEPPLCFK